MEKIVRIVSQSPLRLNEWNKKDGGSVTIHREGCTKGCMA